MKALNFLQVPSQSLVKVGADPELFVMRDSKPVSAVPYFPGSKGHEEPLLSYSGQVVGGVIHDNVSVEFTIPPAETVSQFAQRIADAKTAIMAKLNSTKRPDGGIRTINYFTLNSAGSFRFDKDELASPECATFGCSEDFSAWRGSVNPKPNAKKAGSLRVAGGHIHVGVMEWAPKVKAFLLTDYGKQEFVKLLDMTVGQYIAREESLDPGKRPTYVRRRTLYGAAGAFRPKEYGVEYRSPSSVWTNSYLQCQQVYKLVQATANLIESCENPDTIVEDFMEITGVTQKDVIDSINLATPIPQLLALQDKVW